MPTNSPSLLLPHRKLPTRRPLSRRRGRGSLGYADTYQTACDTPQMASLGGATGWLTTQAPIAPGETFTLEFMIWDAGDGVLDSSVLIDNFQWIGGSVTTGTSRVN